MTRFRDTLTGLFTKSRSKRGTVAESGASARLRAEDHAILADAVRRAQVEQKAGHHISANVILVNAFEKVLAR